MRWVSSRGVVCVLVLWCLTGCQRSIDLSSLEPLPATDLSRFAEDIQGQLTTERSKVESLQETTSSTQTLARAYGDLGRLYQAYGLHPPAAVSYRNALALNPEEPLWWYLRGVIEQTDGDLEAAAVSLERAREQLQTANPQAVAQRAVELRLATLYVAANRNQEAQDLLREVVRQQDDLAAAHFALGRLAAARGETETAIDYFERTLELQPQATTVHYVLGVAYRRLGEADKAQTHIDAMGAVEPSFPDPWVDDLQQLVLGIGPHLDRGQRAVEGGRFDEAEREYRAALALEPENSTALRGLAYTFRKGGKLHESVKALNDMLVIYPEETAARLELATTWLEIGDFDQATVEFERLLEIDPSFELAYLNLGVVRSRQNRWPEAMDLFLKVLELNPKDRKARYHVAVSLDVLGRPEESLALLEELAEEYPRWVEVRQRLGLEYLKRDALAAAANEHRAVLETVDAPPQEKALAHYQLAKISERQGDLDATLSHYGEARQLFPGLWQAALGYGNTLARVGRFDEAATQYRALVEIQPQDVGYRQLEVRSLMRAGDFATAARRLEEGLAQHPAAAELGHLKARMLAISTDARLRNGALAFDLANQIFERFPSLEHGETLAMALAEQGRFGEALSFQQQVIERARSEGRDDLLPALQLNFQRYSRGEPARGW